MKRALRQLPLRTLANVCFATSLSPRDGTSIETLGARFPGFSATLPDKVVPRGWSDAIEPIQGA